MRLPPRMAARCWASGIVRNDNVYDMADRLKQFVDTPPGRLIASQLGLPQPADLRRYEPGQPLVEGSALVGGAAGGRLLKPASDVLRKAKVKVVKTRGTGDEERFGAVVYDASGIGSS